MLVEILTGNLEPEDAGKYIAGAKLIGKMAKFETGLYKEFLDMQEHLQYVAKGTQLTTLGKMLLGEQK